jgi:predicted nuclease with TOPRIM domain
MSNNPTIRALTHRAEKAEAERDELKERIKELESEIAQGELVWEKKIFSHRQAEARVKELETFKRWFALFEEQAMCGSDHQVISFCKAVRQNTDYEIKEKGDE